MAIPQNPSIYQADIRVWLRNLSDELDRAALIDDIPDDKLSYLANIGIDYLYLIGGWSTGEAARNLFRSDSNCLTQHRNLLFDLTDSDICGSCYAIADYSVDKRLGGNSSLERFRYRLYEQNLLLILDFVPHITALDHSWVHERPDFYVHGKESDLESRPDRYKKEGSHIIAHGRDPYFPAWRDTYQLNYGNPSLQDSMNKELVKISKLCDGIRCDMAMLIQPEIFEWIWGIKSRPFWKNAINNVRGQFPDFIFVAEAYWDKETELQNEGFDFTYDKILYNKLRFENAGSVLDYLRRDITSQMKMVRFMENHDEERAANAFSLNMHQSAAIITYLSPGMKFFYDGQFEGRKKKPSINLNRWPDEPLEGTLQKFYMNLLRILNRSLFRAGDWRLLPCRTAWEGNLSWKSFIAFLWQSETIEPLLIVVNYGPNQGQCYVILPIPELQNSHILLRDIMSPASYHRDGDLLFYQGLYLDIPGWSYHIFEIESQE